MTFFHKRSVIDVAIIISLFLPPAVLKMPRASIRDIPHEEKQHSAGEPKIQSGAMLDRLPLHFVESDTKLGSGFMFTARGAGIDVGIKSSEAVIKLHEADTTQCDSELSMSSGNVQRRMIRSQTAEWRRKKAQVRLQFVGTNPRAHVVAEDRLPGCANFFVGHEEGKWRTNVRIFSRVRVSEIYSGVDVVYYGSGRHLEFDFKVGSGADYTAIRVSPKNVSRIDIDESGDAVMSTEAGTLRQHKPVAYQLVNGRRNEVDAHYIVNHSRELGFQLGPYDRSIPLIIDPVVSYSTFLGGTGNDSVNAIAIDPQGNAIIAGSTNSSDLPITPGAFQSNGNISGGSTGFVAKIDPTNNRLLYLTYLGGRFSPGNNVAATDCLAVATDSAGNAYITGWTIATDFPTTSGGFQRALAGATDAFVAKLNPMGTALVYSSYLGSSKSTPPFASPSDQGLSIAVDSAGNAYVTGKTFGMDFPVTEGALKTVHVDDFGFVGQVDPAPVGFTDGFVAKLNPTGGALIYSTYLGGKGDDSCSSIKVDDAGNAYIVGTTRAADFPATNAVQQALAGGSDAFIAMLNETGDALVYSTYVGGTSDDSGKSIAIDQSGNMFFSGTTASTDLPVTPGSFQTTNADCNIYKTTDGGARWAPSNMGMPGNSVITQISVDPANSLNIYAGTENRVFNSTDGGQLWRSRQASTTVAIPSRILTFDPKRPTTVYGVFDLGFFFPQILKSSNGGQTWEGFNKSFSTDLPIRTIVDLIVDPLNSSTIYASTEQGLFKSMDDDGNWVRRIKGLPNDGAFARILAIDPGDSDRLYALEASELFMSSNGGKSWDASGPSGSTILDITFDPLSPSTIYGSGAGLFKSTDRGQSWREVDNDLPTFGFGKVTVDPINSSIIYTTTIGGVFKSTDGGHHWLTANEGLAKAFIEKGGGITLSIDQRNPSTLYVHADIVGTDVFVGKLNSSRTGFDYLTYFGGAGFDNAAGLAIDRDNNAYFAGDSASDDLPVLRALQPDKLFQSSDLFLAKLGGDGSTLSFSTYLGGSSQDHANTVDFDRTGNAYVAGYTFSPDLLSSSGLQSTIHPSEGFLVRISDSPPFQPGPEISEVIPSSGSSAGQYNVKITGANFSDGARLRIGGVPVTIAELTSSAIRGRVNGRASSKSESVDVVVSNADGQSVVRKNGFTFLPQPKIDVVSLIRKELAVFGSGFDKGSMILLNGGAQKSRLGISEFRSILLLSKKAAKRIAPGETARLTVMNGFGLMSLPFFYTRPLN